MLAAATQLQVARRELYTYTRNWKRREMTRELCGRLKKYYIEVGNVLRGQADSASILPNPTDVGMSRERVHVEFLRLHLPSSCNVLFGGFLFNLDGDESKQLDLIVTSDSSPHTISTTKMAAENYSPA